MPAVRAGIASVAVTAGYIGIEARREFYAKMDAANVDLKGFTDEFYVKLCGARLQPVLDTLVYLKHETDVWFEITTLLIPGKNDSAAEIEAMSAWIVRELGTDVPLHFTAFHPDYKMTDIERTPASTLTRARDIALEGRHSLRVHRQRARPHRRDDVLPRLRQGRHRPRLARDPALRAHRRRSLPALRRAASGAIRGVRGSVGSAPRAGSGERRGCGQAAHARRCRAAVCRSARDRSPIVSMCRLARACVSRPSARRVRRCLRPKARPTAPTAIATTIRTPTSESFWAWKLEQWRDGLPPKPPPGGWNLPYVKTDAAALPRAGGQPVGDVDRACDDVRPARRQEHPVRSGVRRARIAVQLRGPEAHRSAADRHRRAAAHRRRADLAQSLRSSRRGRGDAPRRDAAGQPALRRAARAQGVVRDARHHARSTNTTGGRKRAKAISRSPSCRCSTGASAGSTTPTRRYGAAGSSKAKGCGSSTPATPATRRTSATSASASARSTWPSFPIGAYAPRWFMQVMHVDVPEAVQIRADLKAARAIGMHWGTFESLTDEPLDEPPRELAKQRAARGLAPVEFDVLKIGETRRLEKPQKVARRRGWPCPTSD